MQDKKCDVFVTMTGFARRAGKIVLGMDRLKVSRGIRLLAVGDNASDNLKSDIARLSEKLGIPLVLSPEMSFVGPNVKALGLTDANMVKAVTDYMSAGDTKYKLIIPTVRR